MMRILLLSRYDRTGASSRVRSYQYIPFMEAEGWTNDVRPLFSDAYLQALYNRRSRFWHVLAGYWRRLRSLVGARKYDLIWIEKEIFPFMPAFAERLLVKAGIPYVVDYDDATFHRYDNHRLPIIRWLLSKKIDVVMKQASLVIAGNEYLAEKAHSSRAQRVEIVPTVVDLLRYEAANSDKVSPLVVGWIGSPSTSRYLILIAPAITTITSEFDVRFVAVGASKESVGGLAIECRPWSEESEVRSIQDFDIGIMPLVDDPWERGKCGYKLIQFMACGLPVVASPVGVNAQIIDDGKNGFLAKEPTHWEQALKRLLSDSDLRLRMGTDGRKRVEERYSLQVQAPRLVQLIRSVLE